MADVKWIKITTDMFSNRKIKHLRKLPEGNSIVLIWVMLLTMAGRCNSGGTGRSVRGHPIEGNEFYSKLGKTSERGGRPSKDADSPIDILHICGAG